MHEFQYAAGSVIGRDHRVAGKNNQDALCVSTGDTCDIVLVADGCSAGTHSEVGAQAGVQMVSRTIRRHVELYSAAGIPHTSFGASGPFWEGVRLDVLRQLHGLAQMMGQRLSTALNTYCLFTIVGALLTKERASFFSVGDGIIIVNGEMTRIGPFPNNEPPYLAYGLVPTSLERDSPALLRLQVHREESVESVDSFLIGTDGVGDLHKVSLQKVPNKDELVGPLSQFWSEDRYFKNRDMLRRRLTIANRDVTRASWDERELVIEHGLLPDDTTIVTGRRVSSP